MDLVLQFSDDKEGRTALNVLQEDLNRRSVPGLVKYSVVYPPALNGRAKKLIGDSPDQDKQGAKTSKGALIKAILSGVKSRFSNEDAIAAAARAGFTSRHGVHNALFRAKSKGKIRSVTKGVYEVMT